MSTKSPKVSRSTPYRIGKRLERAAATRFYEPGPGEPLRRKLRVYALNPAVSRLDGGLAVVKVPYEPLAPGPVGSVVEVSNLGPNGTRWSVADLEDPFVLMEDGYRPSLADPCFHQQMAYAVAMMTCESFKTALGRDVSWAFDRRASQAEPNRLLLRPHGAEEPNAWYDSKRGEIVFGYFKAHHSTSVVQKNKGYVFTCVSHDVVTHEMTHALLDGLRAHFLQPTHADVLAFHEAFADLVAFFQHFNFDDVVRVAVARTRGDLDEAKILVEIAREFGQALDGNGQALRTLNDVDKEFDGEHKEGCSPEDKILQYGCTTDQPHDRGRVLARAVYSAFLTIYKRRARPYIKLATGGTGMLAEGDLAKGLEDILVFQARRLAGQFLSICIRAIDYCPPVDIRFGDFLRSLITADRDLVPDDDLGYREAIIEAFGRRGIYGEGTTSMMEDALCWNPPRVHIPQKHKLSLSSMSFDGDPAKPVSPEEMLRQADALGRLVTMKAYACEFGLVSPLDSRFEEGGYDLPVIESIRIARRVGPDRQVTFDLIAEVIQTRRMTDRNGLPYQFFGGSTVIIDAKGNVRLIIRKRVNHEERHEQQTAFMAKDSDERIWSQDGGALKPKEDISRSLCMRTSGSSSSSVDKKNQ